MRRTIVVLGVVAAFLFATFGAYAENTPWGGIKASFVERPTSEAGEEGHHHGPWGHASVRLAKRGEDREDRQKEQEQDKEKGEDEDPLSATPPSPEKGEDEDGSCETPILSSRYALAGSRR